ncbi:AAA family ATPase [Patescibacteria group bacterium]|nr:MAG: AAA family ATPase [Patescibacteria group bacterium]
MNQERALQILKTGANVFLTGEPGSGKTHTVNAYARYLRQRGIAPAITASTGIAATHIGGFTIHSWSGIGVAPRLDRYLLDKISTNERVVKRAGAAKVLVIDEVSMLGPETLSMVDAVLREIKRCREPFGGLQIILVGDFFQLPPVEKNLPEIQNSLLQDRPARFAFDSPGWKNLRPMVCYLTEQHRQDDPQFLGLLSAIRGNRFSDNHLSLINSRKTESAQAPDRVPKLFSHNIDVGRVNDETLSKLPGPEKTFFMSSRGNPRLVEFLIKGCLSPEKLCLKKGAAVMFTKNNQAEGYVNGTLGVVQNFSESGAPIIKTRGGRFIDVTAAEWALEDNGRVLATIEQLPLRLAWAITVHKSQGMSLDEATMDLSRVFEYGQGYVALSRVRRLSGVHLLGWNERAFAVHPEVLEKDQEFRTSSLASEEAFAKLPDEELKKMSDNFVVACGGQVGGVVSPSFIRRGQGEVLQGSSRSGGFDKIRQDHPNAYRPWEPEQDEELKKLFARKTSIKDISKKLGRKKGGITSRLVRLGVVESREQARAQRG